MVLALIATPIVVPQRMAGRFQAASTTLKVPCSQVIEGDLLLHE